MGKLWLKVHLILGTLVMNINQLSSKKWRKWKKEMLGSDHSNKLPTSETNHDQQ